MPNNKIIFVPDAGMSDEECANPKCKHYRFNHTHTCSATLTRDDSGNLLEKGVKCDCPMFQEVQ